MLLLLLLLLYQERHTQHRQHQHHRDPGARGGLRFVVLDAEMGKEIANLSVDKRPQRRHCRGHQQRRRQAKADDS